MFAKTRPILVVLIASIFAVNSASAFYSPLSDTAVRSAYFLGQRYKDSTGLFFTPYTRNLPAPKAGPYVTSIQFLTPFAQLVREYATRVGTSSAQQAQMDHRGKEETVVVIVRISLTPTYSRFFSPSEMAAAGLSQDQNLRPSTFWRDFRYQVFDNDAKREPESLSGRGDSMCGKWGGNCILIGATVTLEFPASSFTSQLATVEVTGPDGQIVHADFDLASLR
jgi:hypothetical protein